MLYAFVRPLAKIGISIFFRRIYLTHTENIPKNKPVILACNHPTAFLEPCILACFLDRPLYYLVRGDYFDKPIYNFLLRALHMLPVYRRRDGDYSRIKDNFATFDACFDTLKKNKTLTIYPEGRTLV
jgi:glycerol-3-phosphate O-acyltransferase/dihydroxyacetone phosphate acyltransferase